MTSEMPVWQPDEDASSCYICDSHFTVFNRRHHCRKCGKIVCAECSGQQVKYFPRTMIVESSGLNYRLNPSLVYKTCDVCAEEIKMIRRALDPADDGDSVTKYSRTRTSTRMVDSSTNSSINTYDDRSDDNLCPVCAINMKDMFVASYKHGKNVTNADFEQFKEDHINGCLTRYDFDQSHDRYIDPEGTRKHPRNKMLVYNMPPIPQPKYETIPGGSDGRTADFGMAIPGTSYDTIRQSLEFNIGSITSNSTFQQEEKDLGEENECVICLEELKPGDKVGRLECLCVFHYKCIKDWFNKKGYGECPVHYLQH